jgi:stage II sporulation protein D
MNVYQDSVLQKRILEYNPDGRDVIFPASDTIRMKRIRDDWKLPSAMFSVYPSVDSVILRGNGFGHGVGLCQEGAMQMSEKGYSYEQILKHYYNDIQIIPVNRVQK